MTIFLPFFLPTTLPDGDDYAPIAGLEVIDGTALAWLESHCEESKSLLISQFRKPRIEAFLCALMDGVEGEGGGLQEVENALWALLTERWLDTAVGAQLDMIGRIVDLPRAGWLDPVYRVLLGAWILVTGSTGTWPDLVAILDALGIEIALVTLAEPGPATLRIVLGAPVETIDAGLVFAFLRRAKSAAYRFELFFPVVDVASTFTLGDAADALELDDALGFGDATGADVGGYLAGALATLETV